jgi:hypothetical protein
MTPDPGPGWPTLERRRPPGGGRRTVLRNAISEAAFAAQRQDVRIDLDRAEIAL